ncbi:uncharacterized protein [Ptychodera flava]|uniref:uncharacterized protein n=1 Tax=Ptychodera flava TaxID=63121 RepID=UPI003969D1BA
MFFDFSNFYNNGGCSEWTSWMSDENGGTLDPSSIGEFEIINQLRGTHGFCDDPIAIECRLAVDPHSPHDQTNQVSLTCDLNTGFLCFHSQQTGDCFDYEIRLLCPSVCDSETTPQPIQQTSEARLLHLTTVTTTVSTTVTEVTFRRCECYKYTAVCSQSNWDDAKTSCEGDGGWLATMDKQELWEQLQTSIDDANMDKKSCHGNGFWIGFHDPDRSLDGSTHDETAFEWIYPMCESFVTWAAGQPNDNQKHDDSDKIASNYGPRKFRLRR